MATRRQFCLSAAAALARPADARPNILFCIADDWAFGHAGIYGDPIVRTPNFDRVARQGVLFTHAFTAAPSCTPSRAAILTGQAPHRLEEGGNLHGFLPKKFAVYPDLLEEAGYAVGLTGKGWGPGNFKAGGRERNPAGPTYRDFGAFLKSVPEGKPFCYWFGSTDPHRAYEPGSGLKAGFDPAKVKVPPFWPDTPEVRSDILDYYFEVERFDRDVGAILEQLEAAGKADHTLVVITGDNGWPFPRAKASLYDAGTRQSFALRWPSRIRGGRTVEDFVTLADLAPTFLEAAGLTARPDMTGGSLFPLIEGKQRREQVFVERERHANVRRGDLSYPSRAVRTRDFLYIRNFRPDRWPAGDPEPYFAVGRYGDVDDSPTKNLILDGKLEPYYTLGFAKRPAEELYDLRKDPYQIRNVAAQPQYAGAKSRMRDALKGWMRRTADPRATSDDDRWDKYPYFGAPAK